MTTPMRDPAASGSGTTRPGFTLVELIIVTTLSLLVLIAVGRTISIQGRGFQHQATVVQSQGNSRTAVQVLASELKEVSATGGDLVSAGENSITLRSLGAVGIICYADNAGTGEVDVWAVGGTFEAGDSVLVFLNHDPELATDDGWTATSVSGISSGAHASCEDWPAFSLRGTASGTHPKRRLSLTDGVDGALEGGPVRSFDVITYALETVDGSWALTRQVNTDPAVALVRNLAPPADDGLLFGYFDTDGAPLTTAEAAADPADVGRITVTVKARTAGPQVAGGDGTYEDVLTTSIYLRNNFINQTFTGI